jgi:hypothetical protein
MATDRSIRTLGALAGASSSRVFNLCSLAALQENNPGYKAAPFFVSPVFNTAIILKHSLRENEQSFFTAKRALSTKVIVPFNTKDLGMGGRSLFVGQKNFREVIEDVGNYKAGAHLQHDIDVLQLIDGLPSLDPFLVRELLSRSGFKPDTCYFGLSGADQQRMADYSSSEIQKLTLMAAGGNGSIRDVSTQRMTKALLSNEVNELLDPFRVTLQLDQSQFGEGIYSWRGFLYYKWGLQELWPRLTAALRSMKGLKPSGKISTAEAQYLKGITDSLIVGVKVSNAAVRKIIAVYDDAYAGLVERKDPKQFRDFLLSAPSLFVDLGEKMGAMSHIVSFWQYRFPEAFPKAPDAEELVMIFQDFALSMGLETAPPR